VSVYVDDSGYEASDPKRQADLSGTRMKNCSGCDQLPWNCECDDGPEFSSQDAAA
jgi:hypothetical protein